MLYARSKRSRFAFSERTERYLTENLWSKLRVLWEGGDIMRCVDGGIGEGLSFLNN